MSQARITDYKFNNATSINLHFLVYTPSDPIYKSSTAHIVQTN